MKPAGRRTGWLGGSIVVATASARAAYAQAVMPFRLPNQPTLNDMSVEWYIRDAKKMMNSTLVKRIFLTFVILLLGGFAASAQTMEEEVARVREQLGVSESTPITLADSSNLPTANPLKVYLALGLDMEVRKRTIERIDDWNKHDARKYVALNIVSERSQADVILIHFSDRDRAYSKVRGTEGNIHTTTYIPGSSYIVVPKGTGYEVLWRYQGKSIERKHGPGVPGQTLRDHFFDMLKHRNK